MIVVVGATGNTGRALVRELAESGAPFRALVRDAARARGALGPEVELVEADLTRPETLGAALKGAESVYAAVGGTPHLVELEAV